MRRTVARRAERSRSDFVCPGMSGRDWCGGPWRAGPSVEVGLCLSGDVGERLVKRTVAAGPSVRGRTLFVRAMSVSYGVLSSSGMGRFCRIFV